MNPGKRPAPKSKLDTLAHYLGMAEAAKRCNDDEFVTTHFVVQNAVPFVPDWHNEPRGD